MNIEFDTLFSGKAKKYIQKLSSSEQGKVRAHVEFFARGEFELIETKTINGPI